MAATQKVPDVLPHGSIKQAFEEIPESCHRVRSILTEATTSIMNDLNIPLELAKEQLEGLLAAPAPPPGTAACGLIR